MTLRKSMHQVISASAGSGKTFQLATRYVALLLRGVEPSRIVGLTFSRKAAGEILDKIIARLAEAASSKQAAADLENQLREAEYTVPGKVDRTRILETLRKLLSALHLARIGTLDSFYVSILRAFPFEFGLGGAFEITDGYEANLAKARVLEEVLHGTSAGGDGGDVLLEDFKLATFGLEEKNFGGALDRFITKYHGYYLEAPDEELWGNAARIWPGGFPYAFLREEDRTCRVDELRSLLADRGLNDRQNEKWRAFLDAAQRFEPGTPIDKALGYVLDKCLADLAGLEAGNAVLTVFRKMHLTPRECGLLLELTHHVIACELGLRLNRTQGLSRVLRLYERVYARLVRGSGKLSFADVLFLLAQPARSSRASASQASPPERLHIDYRLDGTFDHWLLDEFQDTSTTQWIALRDLIDEVLQDVAGERSLFYVGDVKQAIYGWRGGDYELFHRVVENYNSAAPLIETRSLARSWRSSRPVIDSVNKLFGNIDDSGLPTAVSNLWKRGWTHHSTVKTELTGSVEFYSMTRDGKAADQRRARFDATADILSHIDPVGRGLSAAVLVRSNSAGRTLVTLLRAAGLDVCFEGAYSIADNQVTACLLSLLKFASHPGDTFAWRHLQMSPVALWMDKAGPAAIIEEVLEDVSARGFEHFVWRWARRFTRRELLDSFAVHRLEQLARAAAEFDATGHKDQIDFIDYVRAYEVTDTAAQGSIRVMTMHKAKGLEFDVVVLPEMDGRTSVLSSGGTALALQKDDTVERRTEWVLSLPKRVFMEAEPTLNAYLVRLDADHAYEQLCLLYVAMTRARRGLYIVATDPAANSTVVTLSTLVRQALWSEEVEEIEARGSNGRRLYRHGAPDWFLHVQPTAGAVAEDLDEETIPSVRGKGRTRLDRQTPSGEEDDLTAAGLLFSPVARRAADLGTAVHELFEHIEWSENADPQGATALVTAGRRPDDPVLGPAVEQFSAAMEMPSVRQALAKPDGPAALWRERNFEIVLDDHWISGTFDRVVLVGMPGAWERAVISDYKTSRINSDSDVRRALGTYAPQMRLYRKVLAALTGLSGERIELRLLFTRTGLVEIVA